jgi:hypothetical protein
VKRGKVKGRMTDDGRWRREEKKLRRAEAKKVRRKEGGDQGARSK